MYDMESKLTEQDYKYLGQCVELAEEALEAGDEPFGSVLVNADGEIIAEARNHANTDNVLRHPEYDLAAWAVKNLTEKERAQATMYTSGEHCPMCSAAHAWAGLGNIVFLSSAEQLGQWQREEGAAESAIQFIPAHEIVKNSKVIGPGTGELLERIEQLQRRSITEKNR